MTVDVCYFPAVLRSQHDSPIDALVALGVPRDEAMELVVASWTHPARSLLAWVDGGRPVAVLPLEEGRWAACNAFPEQSCREAREAARRAGKLAKRGRRGLVGVWQSTPAGTMAP